MLTNSKSIIIAAGAVLVAAFFMPWVNTFFALSAWDIFFRDISRSFDATLRFGAAIIPITGILVIYGAAFNNERYVLPKKLLFLLPVITLIMIAIAIGSKFSQEEIRGFDTIILIRLFGIGFWLTLVASIILPFTNSRRISKNISTQQSE